MFEKIKLLLYWFVIKLSRKNKVFRISIDYLSYFFYKTFRRNKTFVFTGKTYKYFYHLYNRTIASERTVEIPIVYDFVKEYKSNMILEVGNVLSHYFSVDHLVLDKYEREAGVINQDVSSFNFKKKYDLIVSISTMEHVGFNYGEKKSSDKFLRGFVNLKKHLNKGGMIIITMPLFFNPAIDRLIVKRKMPFNREFFMQRYSFWNEWKQVRFAKAVKGANYEGYFANSNVLYIGIFKN